MHQKGKTTMQSLKIKYFGTYYCSFVIIVDVQTGFTDSTD